MDSSALRERIFLAVKRTSEIASKFLSFDKYISKVKGFAVLDLLLAIRTSKANCLDSLTALADMSNFPTAKSC